MYVYSTSMVRPKYAGDKYIEQSVEHLNLHDVRESYLDVILVLDNILVPGTYYVRLSDCEDELKHILDTVTVGEWLIGRDYLNLPTIPELPEVISNKAKFRDLAAAGYKVEPSHPTGATTGLISDPDNEDLLVFMPFPEDEVDTTNYQLLADTSLFTVNGLIHRGVGLANGVLLKSGGKSVRRSGQTMTGLISFMDIGPITCIHPESDDIHTPVAGKPLYNETWIRLSEDIGDRIPILIMGGFMIFPSEQMSVVGDNLIKVLPEELGFLDKWFIGRANMDLSEVSMQMRVDVSNPSVSTLADLTSDEVIRAYFTAVQSFVVLVETDNLYLTKRKLEYTHLPDRYYDSGISDDVLFTAYGRVAEYLSFPDFGKWVVAVNESKHTRPLRNTTDEEALVVVDDANESHFPWYHSPGHMVSIWSDRK